MAERLKRQQVDLLNPSAEVTFTRSSTYTESTFPGTYNSTITGTASTTELYEAFTTLVSQFNAQAGLINSYLYVFQNNQLAT